MGLIGKLKNRALGRRGGMDYEEVRSHILGDVPEPPMRDDDYDTGPPMPAQRTARAQNEEFPFIRSGKREPIGIEPLQSDFREPIEFGKSGDNYEVVDRLKFIETQLSAIKSQTETINERLKNIEMRLGRRY